MRSASTAPHGAPSVPRRPRRRFPLLLVIILLLAVGLGGFAAGRRSAPATPGGRLLWLRSYLNLPADRTAPADGFWVAGYWLGDDSGSLQTAQAQVGRMDQLVLFGYGFDKEGNVTGADQELLRGITGRAKRVILFGNMGPSGFDKNVAHAILTNSSAQERAIRGILSKAQQLDAGGVQIDFEMIPDADRDAYTAFLGRLKDELRPHGQTLSVAVAAKTYDARDGWGGATDYAAVGRVVDYVYLMAYDEHWQGGEPGPVASLGWVERVVRYAIGVIPSQKVVLGLPLYGYEWSAEPGAGAATNKAYGPGRMERRTAQYGGQAQWSAEAGEVKAVFQTEDGQRVAWYPDRRSLEAKLRLAYQYNLKGVAFWRLGLEPDEWWEPIGAFRQNPAK